jgi:hypothetical protein
MKKYQASTGYHRMTHEKAQQYGEHLADLAARNDDQLEPVVVVTDARRRSSPLHDYFEWDEKVAAHEYHLVQARNLIRSVEVVIKREGKEVQVRAFHSVVIKRNDHTERAYAPVERVMSEPELRAQVIDRALRELESWQERYSKYKELGAVFSAIRTAREDVTVMDNVQPVAAMIE